ncbi:hypothetical protein G6F32_015075 [Rhizopus arrhizus]|nr:hypothetical protein G6F32_015075 [Rhizopus arrhizus]
MQAVHAVAGQVHDMALFRQSLLQVVGQFGFVFDDQDAHGPEFTIRAGRRGGFQRGNVYAGSSMAMLSAGKRSAKTLPLPGSLVMSSSASWRMAMCLVIARPRPVPPTARERPRSTR